jgi:predicted Zn-dependent protease
MNVECLKRRVGWPRFAVFCLLVVILQAAGGCGMATGPEGGGPGHRRQVLALSPDEELALGREAYRRILAESDVLPPDDPVVTRVRRVGQRVVAPTRLRPLMREINLRGDGDQFEWEFNVIDSRRVNAFCLPAGKVGIFTGMLRFVSSDDELANVIAHEVAHALAHHASERLALNPGDASALRASGGELARLDEARRRSILGLLSAGASLDSLAYNRFQESEADHIGVFLAAFAGYDPEAALAFWERMREQSAGSIRLPEFLSDHPADGRRIAQLRGWVPLAEGAKQAYDRGDVVSESAR